MILDTLQNAATYTGLLKNGLAEGFGFLDRPDLAELPDGRYQISHDRVYAIVSRTQGRSAQEGQLEAHQKYIDIQYLIAGYESMGWKSTMGLEPATSYDVEKDLQFFKGRPDSLINISPGAFVIFRPTDAHLPQVGEGPIHKVVVKVAID